MHWDNLISTSGLASLVDLQVELLNQIPSSHPDDPISEVLDRLMRASTEGLGSPETIPPSDTSLKTVSLF